MTRDPASLHPFLHPEQRRRMGEAMRVTGLSEGAAVALALAREALQDWCPPEERVKVLVFLLAPEVRQP